MSAVERKCSGSPEKTQTPKPLSISSKFRAYRLLVESMKIKLREAQAATDVLRDDLNLSRNAEKNLRSQIASAQNRLISLQEILKKFINISNQQNQNEKVSQRIQEKIQQLEENINKIREKSESLLKCSTKEIDLLKKIKELESILEAKNSESYLMNMEIQTLQNEKKNMETEFQEKLKKLENSMENLQKKENETELQCRETLLSYKHQIEDYEQKIDRYEKERKCFLEEFEFPKSSEVNPCKFAWPDNTINIIPEKRLSKALNSKIQSKTHVESKGQNKIFQCSPTAGKPKLLSFRKSQNSLKISKKEKPQLDFLTQDSPAKINLEGSARKRRLFSTNSNHYID